MSDACLGKRGTSSGSVATQREASRQVGPPGRGAVIIAAHNEEAVIGRTLDALAPVAAGDGARVVVICNGCTDHTADLARARTGVVVSEIEIESKTAALREGDRIVGAGPRIYLDADVVLTSRAATDVLAALKGSAIAGRPPHAFDTSGANWLVKRWYEVRAALPSISSALWGAGCYGLSEAGRARFDEFPEVVSDDLFIDHQFDRNEVVIIDTDPVVVTTPRRLADLVRILRRSYRTQTEIASTYSGLSAGQRGQLADLRSVLRRSPHRLGDVLIYIAIIAYSRVRARTSSRAAVHWERDVSSREVR